MRFSKRKSTLAALGRRLFGKQQEHNSSESTPRNEGIISEERDALLDGDMLPDRTASLNREEDYSASLGNFSMDPIQRLWVKLGHFSRQLSRAQTGADAAGWDEQAMTDLAEALDIALNNDLQMICTPLIDVGRILASYQAVGKPAHCLPFLFEAYDQLSMIAGDVVVGTVSEAVQRRWEELYEAQVRRMREEGIPLIEDDENEEDASASVATEGSESVPAEPAVAFPPDAADTAPDATGSNNLDSAAPQAEPASSRPEDPFFRQIDHTIEQMDNLPDTPDADIPRDLPPPPPDESTLSSDGWRSVISEISAPPDSEPSSGEAESATAPDLPPVREDAQPAEPVADTATVEEPVSMPMSEDAPPAGEPETPPVSCEQHDAPLEETVQDGESAPDENANLIAFPVSRADEQEAESPETQSGAADAQPDTLPDNLPDTEPAPPRESAAETGDTATVAPPVPEDVETGADRSTPDLPETDTPPEATGDAAEEAPDEQAVAELPAATEAEPETRAPEDPVDALNRAVQEAILAGNIPEARVLAIKLAAALARREVEHAEASISATAQDLETNRARIDEGCQREIDAQNRLQRVETQIAERQEDQAQNRQRLIEIDGDIQARQNRISELEEQIRRLQELRTAELEKLRDRELERETVLARESLLDAELSALEAEAEAAKDFLNDARERLEHLRAEREKLEAQLAAWQQERDRREKHVQEIEAPITSGARAPEPVADPPSPEAGDADQPLLC
ncbi:MAG TPA: hypothetical protein PLO53_01880 [Candidatus Hydrogenedentes bacterium]|nr:hypothetical protein [Candidatus Hydrogenedentota bacterium]